MTVTHSTSRASYAGNGVTTAFTIPFRILDAAHVRVVLTLASGDEIVQVLGTDYSIAGVGQPQSTLNRAFAAPIGTKLTIARDVPITQDKDYVEGDNFPAQSHEDALDKLTMIAQEQSEKATRSLRLSNTDLPITLNELPVLDERANRYLSFDAFGQPIATPPPTVVVGAAEFNTRAAAVAATITAGADFLRIAGYANPGDGGGGLYKRVGSVPSHAGYFTSNGGAVIWELTGTIAFPEQFGGIAGDLASDLTPIQAAIDYCSAIGGGSVLVNGGNWLASAVLNMRSRVRLVGQGATLTSTADPSSIILCLAISDFEVCGFELIGNHVTTPTDSNGGGIAVYTGCTRGLIHDNLIRNCRGNGIDLNDGNQRVHVYDNEIFNCRVGISVFKNNRFCWVETNYIAACREMGINVDDATTPDTAGTAAPNFHITVARNALFQNGTYPGTVQIAVQGSFYSKIIDNDVAEGGRYAPGALVSCRGIVLNAGQGFYNAAAFCTVSGNTVRGNTAEGIMVDKGLSNVISNNTLLDNNYWATPLAGTAEIEITGTAENVAQSNTITGNHFYQTGGNSRSAYAIAARTAYVPDLHIGPNHFRGFDTDHRYYGATAGGMVFSCLERVGAIPAYADPGQGSGLAGRVVSLNSNDKMYINTAAGGYIVVGTQT